MEMKNTNGNRKNGAPDQAAISSRKKKRGREIEEYSWKIEIKKAEEVRGVQLGESEKSGEMGNFS